LKNVSNDEVFIVGRRVDSYPAFGQLPAETKTGLLVTGRRADGVPFLRTVDEDGINDYALESQKPESEGSVWRLAVPASRRPCPTSAESTGTCDSPEMTFRTIDERDMTKYPANVRNVTVEMIIGPILEPYWRGVVVRGHHQKQP
jgi:hypothetical protein